MVSIKEILEMSEKRNNVEKFPDEELVARNVVSFSGDIFQASDVNRFLEIAMLDKVNSIRFFCWLSALKIIPYKRINWIPRIMECSERYEKKLQRYCNDCYFNPLDELKQGSKIRYAIDESYNWFVDNCLYQGLKEEHLEDAKLRLGRLFNVYTSDFQTYNFDKGDERLLMISYMISLTFARRGTLNNIFAESMAFYIFSGIYNSISGYKKLEELRLLGDFDDNLLSKLSKHAPKTAVILDAANVDPLVIHRNWIKTFFVFVHDHDDLLLIWDQLILHHSEIAKFSTYISVAHFMQIPNLGADFKDDEIIVRLPYSVIEICDTAEDIENAKEINFFRSWINAVFPCLTILGPLFPWGHLKED